MYTITEDRKRKIEKVVEWAHKNNIKIEDLTLDELQRAMKSRS